MHKKRYQYSHADAVSGGKLSGRRSLKNKTGLFSMTPDQKRESSSRGGRTQGNIQGKLKVESGQLDRIRQLPQTQKAQSEVGKRTGTILGDTYGKLQDMSRIKTPESLKLGQANGGDKSRHVRWHFNRRVFNFSCGYCLAAIERKENWGILLVLRLTCWAFIVTFHRPDLSPVFGPVIM